MVYGLLDITSLDSCVYSFFFGISGVNFNDGAISKVGNISNFDSLANGQHFPILSRDDHIFDGDIKFFGHLGIKWNILAKSTLHKYLLIWHWNGIVHQEHELSKPIRDSSNNI